MGGMIAQLVAIRHPERVKSLISIMSTTGRPEVSQPKPEAFAAITTPPPANAGRAEGIARGVAVWRVIGSPGFPATDEELTAYVTRGVDYAPYDLAANARQLAAVIAAPPRNDRLRAIRVPTLVIHGADDPLIPVAGGVRHGEKRSRRRTPHRAGAGARFSRVRGPGLSRGDRRVRGQGRTAERRLSPRLLVTATAEVAAAPSSWRRVLRRIFFRILEHPTHAERSRQRDRHCLREPRPRRRSHDPDDQKGSTRRSPAGRIRSTKDWRRGAFASSGSTIATSAFRPTCPVSGAGSFRNDGEGRGRRTRRRALCAR